MARYEWKHKERNWSSYSHDDPIGKNIQTTNGYDSKPNSKFKTFTEWLDWQCEGGWEVFKILRKDLDGRISTIKIWCIFRKKTE